MATFASGGVNIHYEVFGEGRPIVLVHGFAADLQRNWVAASWTETLSPLRRVIALDCRGHGKSDKPHDPSAYGDAMVDDVIGLMDHLGLDTTDLFGYSMGGRISLQLLARYPERFTSAVLGGVGRLLSHDDGRGEAIRAALLAEDRESIADSVAKGFRAFAEATGADREALAAVRAAWRSLDVDALRRVSIPVLVVVGENDTLVGSGEEIARAFPNGRYLTIPDRDHLTVVPDPRFKEAVVSFLRAQG